MAVEICPGQILTIQSTLNNPLADDENSWFNFFVRHSMKIVFTFGLIVTGLWQYRKITQKRQVKAQEAGS